MLRELIIPGKKKKEIRHSIGNIGNVGTDNCTISPDAQITSNILEILYMHIQKSLKEDRSTFKLNMFEKGIVDGGLKRVMPGTRKYIEGMTPNEIKLLLDDIEQELAKRKKKV
jgi:hypothetical protein